MASREKSFLRAATAAKGWQVMECGMESAFFKSAARHAPISSKSTLMCRLIQPVCFYKSHRERLEETSIIQPWFAKGRGAGASGYAR